MKKKIIRSNSLLVSRNIQSFDDDLYLSFICHTLTAFSLNVTSIGYTILLIPIYGWKITFSRCSR